ncbi:hypothetical protein E5V15_02945 [Campylobacter jejuni]|nr:hypothetical protein [Campylobacter jejuni]QDQ35329.1 hypothetical protein E5V15_02945 [Campylobacter jejuni]
MAKLKILAGAYAENEYVYIKNRDEMSNIIKIMDKEKFYISNIASMEVANQDNCKKADGTIASAVVGGMAGGNKQITTVILNYENGSQSLAQADSDMYQILQTMLFDKKSFMLKHKKKKVNFWKYFLIFFVIMIIISMFSSDEKYQEDIKVQTSENAK